MILVLIAIYLPEIKDDFNSLVFSVSTRTLQN